MKMMRAKWVKKCCFKKIKNFSFFFSIINMSFTAKETWQKNGVEVIIFNEKK